MTEIIGHLHVVIVHLPIGILLVGCVFQWLERKPKFNTLYLATDLVFLAGGVFALLAVISGYLLSQSGDYDDSLVTKHQWFGISVAIASVIMYSMHHHKASYAVQTITSVTLFLLIIITGHLGGSITHGSDYLTKSFSGKPDSVTVKRRPIPDVQQAAVYADVIEPVFQAKCYSCHGPNRQKGKFRMDDSTHFMKGGKDGVVVKPGEADKSLLMKRIKLDPSDDDHMPPKEKAQLTDDEVALIHWWIASGASFKKKVKDLEQPQEIKTALISIQKTPEQDLSVPDLPPTPVDHANEKDVAQLKSKEVVVEPVAQNTNYMSANFVIAQDFADSNMYLLVPLKQQLVELKLGNTQITDSAMKTIAQLKNLTTLFLDHTKITDKGLEELKGLSSLRYLNLVGTNVTVEGVLQLKNLQNLRSIYLYQTSIKREDWATLKKVFPKASIDSGGYTVPSLATDTIVVKPPKTPK